MGIEDEVLGTLNLLQMDLGVLEGQTSRGLFSNSIFDPSVIGANAKLVQNNVENHTKKKTCAGHL